MARKTRMRSSRKTRKQRGGNYQKNKQNAALAADIEGLNKIMARLAAERAERTRAAGSPAANAAAYGKHANALDVIKKAGLGPAPKKQSEHRNAANELHKRIEEGHHQLTSTRRY